MELCPICRQTKPDLSIICICGYDFDKKDITDEVKIREYFLTIKSSKIWEKEVRLTKRIHETKQKRCGGTQWGSRGGWKESDTGELIKISKTAVNDNIRLAKAINEWPDLLKYEKKTHALKKLNSLHKGIFFEIFGRQCKTEKELQDRLEAGWEKIQPFKDWDLQDSQKNIGEAGVIDILAHHKSEPKWLIIEIKKGISSDKTVGQIQRYMGWVRENLASEGEQVLGRIISGYPPDENIRLALLNSK